MLWGAAWLTSLTLETIIIAAMMADAGTVVLNLIREFDTENLELSDMCAAVQRFLDKIWWLYHDSGIFSIAGHTAFVLEWLTKPHFFAVGRSDTRCIGGSAISDDVKSFCLEQLRVWTKLASVTCKAEFPEFSLICAYNVFSIPKQLKSLPQVTRQMLVHIQRLSKSFSKPDLYHEFTEHLPWAARAYADSSFRVTPFDAWVSAIQRTEKLRDSCLDSLRYVLQRGMCFSPVTSGIEQSFTALEKKLGSRRLSCETMLEAQLVGLLVMNLPSAEQLQQLCHRARQVWAKAFPAATLRHHKVPRADTGINRIPAEPPARQQTKSTETSFRHNLLVQVDRSAPADCSSHLDSFVPTSWSATQVAEERFQHTKRTARMVEAALAGTLLDHEIPHEDVAAEEMRMKRSRRARDGERHRLQQRLQASPPTAAELHGRAAHVDPTAVLPPDWHVSSTLHQA